MTEERRKPRRRNLAPERPTLKVRRPAGPGPRPPHERKWIGGYETSHSSNTRMPFSSVQVLHRRPDSRTIVFVTSEPAGTAQLPVIYSIQDDGRRLTRISSGAPPQGEGAGGPGGGGGFGGGLGDLTMSRDGRTLFFRERDGIYSIALPAGGAAGAARPAGGGAEAARRDQLPRAREDDVR